MKKHATRIDRFAVLCINFITLLLFAFLFIALIYAAKPRGMGRADTALTYTLKLNAIREEYTHAIKVGDRVLDAVGKRQIGRVTAVHLSPAFTETYSQNKNALVRTPYPGRVDLTLCIETQAKASGTGYSIAGFVLTGGKLIPFRLPNFVGRGVCCHWEGRPLKDQM